MSAAEVRAVVGRPSLWGRVEAFGGTDGSYGLWTNLGSAPGEAPAEGTWIYDLREGRDAARVQPRALFVDFTDRRVARTYRGFLVALYDP